MKRLHRILDPRLLVLFVVAMSSAIFVPACREKRPAGQTINRTDLDAIIKANSRADSLKKALESEFGGRGYTFMVAFASGGKKSSAVETLSGGPASLHVYGTETFEAAMELDRDLNRLLGQHEQAGIEVLYEIRSEWNQESTIMYPASELAKSAQFFAEIKNRQRDGAARPTTAQESKPESSDKPEGRSR